MGYEYRAPKESELHQGDELIGMNVMAQGCLCAYSSYIGDRFAIIAEN